MTNKEFLKWKQESLKNRDNHQWAEGVEDASIDLMAYQEALDEKKKNPKYDLRQDKKLVKALIS